MNEIMRSFCEKIERDLKNKLPESELVNKIHTSLSFARDNYESSDYIQALVRISKAIQTS